MRSNRRKVLRPLESFLASKEEYTSPVGLVASVEKHNTQLLLIGAGFWNLGPIITLLWAKMEHQVQNPNQFFGRGNLLWVIALLRPWLQGQRDGAGCMSSTGRDLGRGTPHEPT